MSKNSPFEECDEDEYHKSPEFKKISRNPYLIKNYSTKKLPFLTHNIMNLIQFFKSSESNNNINISPLNILSKLKSTYNFNQSLNDFDNINNMPSPFNNNIENNNDQNKIILDLYNQNLDNLKRQNILEKSADIGHNMNNNNSNNYHNNNYNNNNYNYITHNNNYNNLNNYNNNNLNKYNIDNKYIPDYNNNYPVINNNSNYLNNFSDLDSNIKIVKFNNKMVKKNKKYINNNNYDNINNYYEK